MTAESLNVPNGITALRIACVPLLVIAVLETPRGSVWVTILFLALALSDALDGHIARSHNLVTTFGKLLDPAADKLLIGGCLLALVATERLLWVVAALIIGRELIVCALRVVAYRRGTIISASSLGKSKMTAQITMITALLLTGAAQSLWQHALVAGTVAITLASALDYFLAYHRATASSPPRDQARVASS
ncbi:MAG TPA: CDP-diacylglycerol--glycerol-3-phosphate 3-phosphatidyltransferase [Solirubrobacteraceae bacterium]|nr:CDP-diacylglycerol--glycerol-3-phosphate 3-phosphatidyltransferase [Solirubrobacteraceae bacterium]